MKDKKYRGVQIIDCYYREQDESSFTGFALSEFDTDSVLPEIDAYKSQDNLFKNGQ